MKINRFLLFSLLICFVFPILSYADQLEDAQAAIKNEEFEKAYELLLPLAKENNAKAQTLLGTLYVNGQGVEKDATKGLSWIMKAATQGYNEARLLAFSICLDLGDQGDATAMYNVGYMCLKGWGGEKDPNVCIGWLETAAKSGHVRSAKVLSQIYTKGMFGITPDEEKASYWINLPAAFAAGIDGTWRGTVPLQRGGTAINIFTFKADDNTLTGVVKAPGYSPIPIKDGKIDGNKFSFAYDAKFGEVKITFIFSGLFLGDKLKLSYLYTGGGWGGIPEYIGKTPLTFIAKRVK